MLNNKLQYSSKWPLILDTAVSSVNTGHCSKFSDVNRDLHYNVRTSIYT